MSDSTNAERPGHTASERTVGASLREIVRTAPGRVIVTSFSSHIHRLQQVIDAAQASGRTVCVIGRSMIRNLNIARNLGYAKVADDRIIRAKRLDDFMPHELVIICTGSQGEPGSALTRIALGDHNALQIHHTDTVVMSARPVPGNEVKVNETVNRLCRLGAKVMTEETDFVHVSGPRRRGRAERDAAHRAPAQLRAGARRVPDAAGARPPGRGGRVPAHAVRIADNGTVLELDADGVSVVDQIEAGTILVDGLSVGNVRDVVLRDRRHLGSDGVLIVVATIAADSAEPLVDPEIIVRGFDAPSDNGELLLEQARAAVERVLEECQEHRTTEVHVVQQRLHDTLADLASRLTGQAPDGAAHRRRGLERYRSPAAGGAVEREALLVDAAHAGEVAAEPDARARRLRSPAGHGRSSRRGSRARACCRSCRTPPRDAGSSTAPGVRVYTRARPR